MNHSAEILFGVAMVIVGVILFTAGYHGFDLGHNLKYLNCELDQDMGDVNNWGQFKSPGELISENINKIYAGFVIAVFGMFQLGYTAGRIK